MKRSHVLLALSLALLLAAAGCEETDNIYLPTDSTVGTLSAQVVAYPQGTPVDGATFRLSSTDVTGTTDEHGEFSVSGLAPGEHVVVVSTPGYATTRLYLAFDAEPDKADYHVHRTIRLVACDGVAEVSVLSRDAGDPVSGAMVSLASCTHPDYSDYYGGDQSVDVTDLAISAVTDDEGVARLEGLPCTRSILLVGGIDDDDDGEYELAPEECDVTPTPGTVVHATATLGPPSEDLQLVATNVPSDYGTSVYAPSLYFVFSASMDTAPAATAVTLTHYDYPYDEVPIQATWTSPVRLIVTPQQPLSEPMTEYRLELVVTSLSGSVLDFTRYLYWRSDTGGGGDCEDTVNDLAILNATAIDFDTTQFELTWSAVPCAGGYRIYAHDDRDNPDWVLIGTDPTDFEVGTIDYAASLPANFDRYDADNIQTPLAGITVTFCVVPEEAASGLPGSPHATVTATDATAPSLVSVFSLGAFINPLPDPAMAYLHLEFSEYLNPSCPTPQLTITESGGDPEFSLSAEDAVWSWAPGMHAGEFAFSVPAGADATGDDFEITLTGAADLSDNTADYAYSGTFTGLPPVWDFENSTQGWTVSGIGWEHGTPTSGPDGAYSGIHCWGTNLDGSYDSNWTSSLLSPVFVVPTTNPSVTYKVWTALEYDYDSLTVNIIAGGSPHEIDHIYYYSDSWEWESRSCSLANYAGQAVVLEFLFTSDDYYESYGAYIDDVSITYTQP